MTYLDGLKAAEMACRLVRERALKDRREARAERDETSASYAASEALAVSLCIERIQALITEQVAA